MHHFLLVYAKNYSARKNFIHAIEQGVEHLVPYKSRRSYYYSLSNNVFFISTQAHDFLKLGKRFKDDDSDFLTYAGFCYMSSKKETVIDLFHSKLKKYGPYEINDHLKGEYCLATYNKLNKTIYGITDFTGIRPLYYFDDINYFAVSNRQMFLNPLLVGTKISLDVIGAIDLISKGNKFTDKSLIKGVQILLPGHCIKFSEQGGYDIQRSAQPIFTARGEVKFSDYLRSIADIVSNIDALDNFPGLKDKPIQISLTGGEDSRLVLASALNSTVKNRIETFTYGFPDNPDIAAAEIVAQKAGVAHEKNVHPVPINSSERSIEGIWNDLRQHAFRYEGAPGAWDGGAGFARQTRLDLTGVFDGYFKRIRPSSAEIDIVSLDIAENFMTSIQQKFDPLSLLQPSAVMADKNNCHQWLNKTLMDGAELNDIPELSFFDLRLPWWYGSIAANIGSLSRITPLASKIASQIGLKQSLKDRREKKFIFHSMLILKPELLEVPYLGKKWPDHFQAIAPTVKLPGKELMLPASQYSTIPWQVTLAQKGQTWIKNYISSHDFSSLYTIIKEDRLIQILSDPGMMNNMASIRTICNLCEILILLAGDQKRETDDIENSNLLDVCVSSNIPELSHLVIEA